jgi:hypothetical protein
MAGRTVCEGVTSSMSSLIFFPQAEQLLSALAVFQRKRGWISILCGLGILIQAYSTTQFSGSFNPVMVPLMQC